MVTYSGDPVTRSWRDWVILRYINTSFKMTQDLGITIKTENITYVLCPFVSYALSTKRERR